MGDLRSQLLFPVVSTLLAGALAAAFVALVTQLGWLRIIVFAALLIISVLLVYQTRASGRPRRLAAFGLLAVTIVALGFSLVSALVSPPATLQWYVGHGNELELLDGPLAVRLPAAGTEVIVPIRLAARNISNGGLRDVQVEIRYPREVQVRAAAKQLLDPENRTLIYRHDLDDLLEQGGAVILPESDVDRLVLPVRQRTQRQVAIDKTHGMPFETEAHFTWLESTPVPVGEEERIFEQFLLQVTLYSGGSKIVEDDLELDLESDLKAELLSPAETAEPSVPARKLLEWAMADKSPWQLQGRHRGKSERVAFKRGVALDGEYQVVAVQEKTRRIIVDTNFDHFRDGEWWDVDADGFFERYSSYASMPGVEMFNITEDMLSSRSLYTEVSL